MDTVVRGGAKYYMGRCSGASKVGSGGGDVNGSKAACWVMGSNCSIVACGFHGKRKKKYIDGRGRNGTGQIVVVRSCTCTWK